MPAGHVPPRHVTIGGHAHRRVRVARPVRPDRGKRRDLEGTAAPAGPCDRDAGLGVRRPLRHRIIVAFRSPTQAGTHSTERKSSRAPQSPPLDGAADSRSRGRRNGVAPSVPSRRVQRDGHGRDGASATGSRERTRAGAVGGVPRLPRRVGPGKGPGYVERRIAGARPCVRPAGRGSAAWDLAALRYVHREALNYTPVICPNYGMWARLGAVDVRIMMIGKVAAQPLRRMLVPKAQHKTACLNIKGDVLTNLLEEHKRWDKEIRYIKAGISS
jgi:hypothetical protein